MVTSVLWARGTGKAFICVVQILSPTFSVNLAGLTQTTGGCSPITLLLLPVCGVSVVTAKSAHGTGGTGSVLLGSRWPST